MTERKGRIEELRNDRIDAEREYKLCVFGRA
jgi:hypothetical protein